MDLILVKQQKNLILQEKLSENGSIDIKKLIQPNEKLKCKIGVKEFKSN